MSVSNFISRKPQLKKTTILNFRRKTHILPLFSMQFLHFLYVFFSSLLSLSLSLNFFSLSPHLSSSFLTLSLTSESSTLCKSLTLLFFIVIMFEVNGLINLFSLSLSSPLPLSRFFSFFNASKVFGRVNFLLLPFFFNWHYVLFIWVIVFYVWCLLFKLFIFFSIIIFCPYE